MNILIMTNGEYGEHEWYRRNVSGYERIICVDGAANMACRLDIVSHLDLVVGDMDSITSDNRERLERAGVKFLIYPPEKDLTDTQIAYELAEQKGATSVTVWGGTGSRLDHTLSTLHNAFRLIEHGIDVCFASPEVTIHLLRDRLVLTGNPGDTVSLIVLGDTATGVTLKGFHYPLTDATINGTWQFCVSNIMTEPHPVIEAASGNIAVFHHHVLPD